MSLSSPGHRCAKDLIHEYPAMILMQFSQDFILKSFQNNHNHMYPCMSHRTCKFINMAGYNFGVSNSSIFHKWLEGMYCRLKPCIRWPDKETVHKTLPIAFQTITQRYGAFLTARCCS